MKFCPYCKSKNIIKKSFFLIKHSKSSVRRYACKACFKTFSSRTISPTYKQKKPFLNSEIFNLLSSGNTQRRIAKYLKCSKNTVGFKLIWLSLNLKEIVIHNTDFEHIQIDELETIEHTKLKPVIVPVCVSHTYKILDLSVGTIKAKGHLAEIALKKYGYRVDEREKVLAEMLESLKNKCKTDPLTITTDAHPLYRKLVRKYFPHSEHIIIVSRDHIKKKRELIYTLERKRIFDPLFALNQRFAMLRSDIRRLTRRSWCTTKKIENLRHHLEIYKNYNNAQLV